MFDHRKNEIIIVENLERYLSTESRECKVIRQNQVAEVPPYPYVTYLPITTETSKGGTYSEAEDGTLYRDILQTWSFTTQSDDLEESLTLALQIVNFFTAAALTLLSDNHITVRRVGNVSSRDNLITIQYEHRNGLDITFGLHYAISPVDQINKDKIETINLKEE